MNKDFHNKLALYQKNNSSTAINLLILKELSKIIVHNRKDFIDLLNVSGVYADDSMSDLQLIDLYTKNVINQKLLLGTAYLVNLHNKTSNADGTSEISDDGVKVCYNSLKSSFCGDYSNADGDSPLAGLAGGAGGGIAGAIGGLATLGSGILSGIQKRKYGAIDAAVERQKAKSALMQQVADQRRAQIEAAAKDKAEKAKITKIALIAGGSIVGIGLVIIGVLLYKKRKGGKK